MKKAHFLLVGVFIILLIILFFQTEGFADLSIPQQCNLALKNLIETMSMPYTPNMDSFIFIKGIDSAVKKFKSKSLKCNSRSLSDYPAFRLFYNPDIARNKKFCSDNPDKCGVGITLVFESIKNAEYAILPDNPNNYW